MQERIRRERFGMLSDLISREIPQGRLGPGKYRAAEIALKE